MALDRRFLREASTLNLPGMGTDNVALLLYAFVRMLRPRVVVELGAGYTSLFLLRAVADAVADVRLDRVAVSASDSYRQRRSLLVPKTVLEPYQPRVLSVDNMSGLPGSASQVVEVAERVGLSDFLVFIAGDCHSTEVRNQLCQKPIDLLWADLGSPADDSRILNVYWPFISRNYGMVLLHDGYVTTPVAIAGGDGTPERRVRMVPSPIGNEARRQLAEAGPGAEFEVLSLVEAQKYRQTGLLILRRLRPIDRMRRSNLFEEVAALDPSLKATAFDLIGRKQPGPVSIDDALPGYGHD